MGQLRGSQAGVAWDAVLKPMWFIKLLRSNAFSRGASGTAWAPLDKPPELIESVMWSEGSGVDPRLLSETQQRTQW